MPGMDDVETLKQIKQRFSMVEVIALRLDLERIIQMTEALKTFPS